MTRHVVTLHGLLRTRYSMFRFHKPLVEAGFTPHHFGYYSIGGTIDSFSDKLHRFIEERVPHGDEVNFITHSLGSIITRNFAIKFSDHHTLGRAVMLGPPNQGSQIARSLSKIPGVPTLLGPAFRELRHLTLPEATDLLEIAVIAGGTGSEKGLLPFVSGDNDGIVAVAETRLEGARDWALVRAPHSFIMYWPEVIRETIHFLIHGRFHGKSGKNGEQSGTTGREPQGANWEDIKES